MSGITADGLLHLWKLFRAVRNCVFGCRTPILLPILWWRPACPHHPPGERKSLKSCAEVLAETLACDFDPEKVPCMSKSCAGND